MRSRKRLEIMVAAAATLLALSAASAGAQAPSSTPLDPRADAPRIEPDVPAPVPEDPPAEPTREAERVPGLGGNPGEDSGRRPSQLALRLKGLRGGKLTAGKEIGVAGTLRPFAKDQRVQLLLKRGKKTVDRASAKVRPKGRSAKFGSFSFEKRLVKPGRYSVEAVHKKSAALGSSKDRTRVFRLRYPDLRKGSSGEAAKLYNKLLGDLGYVNDEGRSFDSATGRATLAFRKVNNMSRTEKGSSGIFKKLANGKGGYEVKHPGAGKHVEVDISRQVMVLANGGDVHRIYHVSTGAPSTPTIPGSWRFYRKEPGFNSLGMYYSVYYNRGYATHGYKSVPTYPASHGCTRNPIPNSKYIYNWIDIGDPIHVSR